MHTKTQINPSLLDPDGDEILYVEISSDDTPHSVVTARRSYDFDHVKSLDCNFYHDSGSGMRDNRKIRVNALYRSETPCRIWHHPTVRLVNDSLKELDGKSLRQLGYAIVGDLTNPFTDASEGKTLYCSVTKQHWSDEKPSPYLRYLKMSGDWGGCGAGEDYCGFERSKHSVIDFARYIGPRKAAMLVEMLNDVDSNHSVHVEYEHDGNYEVHLGRWRHENKHTFTFRFSNDKMKTEFESGIAWLETVDDDKGHEGLVEARCWIYEVLHVQRKLKAFTKGTHIPTAQRAAWNQIKTMAFHTARGYWEPVAQTFLSALKKRNVSSRKTLLQSVPPLQRNFPVTPPTVNPRSRL
jgi:hypothetical protein